MKIKIGIWSYLKNYSVYADEDTQSFIVGLQKLPFSIEFLKNSIEIVKDWPDHSENLEKVTDGVIFKVTYNDGVIERTMTGNNYTPKNFTKLMRLIDEHTPKSNEEQLKESIRDWELDHLK